MRCLRQTARQRSSAQAAIAPTSLRSSNLCEYMLPATFTEQLLQATVPTLHALCELASGYQGGCFIDYNYLGSACKEGKSQTQERVKL